MKRSFREPKNRYKNRAKIARKKISTLKKQKFLKNKDIFRDSQGQKSQEFTENTAKIHLSEKYVND